MKKILMGTSALAMTVGSFAGAGKAEAATWDLDWGGYYEASIAYRDTDTGGAGFAGTKDGFNDDEDGVDVLTDSQIRFTPSIVLDNGLTFGVHIRLNTDREDGDINETYAYVRGPFGQLRMGSTDDASAAMLGSAPDVSWIGASSGSLAGYLDIPEYTGTFYQAARSDAAKIIYFTPRFSGFQAAVSYAHDDNRASTSPTGGYENLLAIGANYVNSFGAFDIALRGGYTTASQIGGNADQEGYAAHLTVGYAGFNIGGSYANHDNDTSTNADIDFFDLGVAYNTGPWGVSVTYSHGESGDDDTDQYLAAVDYDLGPGVRLGAYAGYAEADRGNNSIDGFIVGTGFRLDF